MPDRSERDYSVQTVERGLSILDLFSFSIPERSFTDICHETGLGKATVKRLVYTLERHGYLERQANGRYRLGMRLFHLGNVVSEHLELRSRAVPYLEKLRDKTGETVILVELHQGKQVYLEKLEGLGMVRLTARVGTVRTPFHGMGKIILAYLAPDELEPLLPPGDLPRFTTNTICDRQEFLDYLRIIREQGYEVDDEASVEGMVGVGAPVFDGSGKVVAALGVVAPSGRIRGERLSEIINLTRRVAQTASAAIGSPIGS
jgi:DNA-binding IclR family transcriptional regulator